MAWHTDAPHGPWAYVISLTPDGFHGRADADTPAFFDGGETCLLRPKVLDLWRNFDAQRGLEVDNIVEKFDPQPFGRLLAFDGRVPHSVSKVRGTRDPRRGRLVLTGWFSQPRPSAVGGLADLEGSPNADALAVVESATNDAYSAFEALEVGRVVGFVALRLSVNSDGSVASVEALCDTLRSDNSEFTFPVLDEEGAGFDSADGAVRMILRDAFLEAVFPAAAATVITLPMSFE